MLKSLRHISPKTKILFIVFILILLPGAILSFIGLRSIDQNIENLKIKYQATLNLVRDKLEGEIFKLEENIRNSMGEKISDPNKEDELKKFLRNVESDNPVLKHPFLVHVDGGVISTYVSLGWERSGNSQSFLNPGTTVIFKKAEKAEFIDKNYADAVFYYTKALANTISSREHALFLSRIGRCYFKMGKFKHGINEYRKILRLEDEKVTIGDVPASIVALSQIADGYASLNELKKRSEVVIDLYQKLLNSPWDLIGLDYLYYLESTRTEIDKFDALSSNLNSTKQRIERLIDLDKKLFEHIQFIEHIDKNIVPEIEYNAKNKTFSELPPQHISFPHKDLTVQIGYFILPAAIQQPHILAFGYQIDKDFILSHLAPEVFNSVELGSDLFLGILGENDSILNSQHNSASSNYLVAAHFSQLFPSWKVALFDRDEKSIEQLVGRERQLYLALFFGIIVVMLIGIVFTVRAVIHESEVSRIKSEFVSNVSHELKTPLALIRMFGETLDTGIVTDERKRREFYSIIRKESERLTHLINNVLDFSSIDAGTKEYNFGEDDLVKVVRDSLEAYKFHIRDLGFEIKSQLPAELVISRMDKDAISQVLLNLLSNAVKYSEDRKYIAVEVRHSSTSAEISVTDRGIGIPREHLMKIFYKFYRVQGDKKKETGGSGLGLTLTKHIVEAHGGTIEVESEVGKGSTFTIKIPL